MKKAIRKILASLLVAVIVLSVAPLGAFDFTINSSALAASGYCGNSVTYTFEESTGLLTISGTGEMTSYSSYSSPFYNKTSIKTVIIEDNVTNISNYAFYECTGLTSITIPDSVTSIGRCAFDGCTGLTSVTIPDSVTSIGEYAFWGCSNLINITIPSKVTSIYDFTFSSCDSLTNIIIPDNVTSIGDYAFAYCYSLKNISIGKSVKSIGDHAFDQCNSLISVEIPDSVTSISYYAFEENTGLTNIFVDKNNQYYSSDKYGVLYNKDKTTLIQYPINNSRTTYTIPDSVISIDQGAFGYSKYLKNVVIGSSVTNIGWYAFWNCNNLTSVIIPNSVKTIGNQAFEGCINLSDVYYLGSEKEWNNVRVDRYNECLTEATVHYDYVLEHTHLYTNFITKPDCTHQGYTTYTCICGETFADNFVDALGHDFGEWQVTIPATCTTKGIETRYCSRCEAYETRETEKLAHTYTSVVTPPDCTHQGFTTYTCACGDTYVNDYVDALGHTDGEWKVTKPATYYEEGERTLYCETCKEPIKTEPIPKLVMKIVRDVKIDGISVKYKNTGKIKTVITADEGTKYSVEYKSSNEKVAKVDENGNIITKGKGTAEITCTITDEFGNTVKDTCTVTVKFSFGQWLIWILLLGFLWY